MATQTDKFNRALGRLDELLREKPLTAKQIAVRLRCSKPTVYTRLHAFALARGCSFTVTMVRTGKSGPKAKAYSLP